MLKVWVGLEARSFLQASIDTVCSRRFICRFLLTSDRLSDVSNTTNYHQTYERALKHTSTAIPYYFIHFVLGTSG